MATEKESQRFEIEDEFDGGVQEREREQTGPKRVRTLQDGLPEAPRRGFGVS